MPMGWWIWKALKTLGRGALQWLYNRLWSRREQVYAQAEWIIGLSNRWFDVAGQFTAESASNLADSFLGYLRDAARGALSDAPPIVGPLIRKFSERFFENLSLGARKAIHEAAGKGSDAFKQAIGQLITTYTARLVEEFGR